MRIRVARTARKANADHDAVFYDRGGPGEHDGLPWSFAPDDSGWWWRFATKAEAKAFAREWIRERGDHIDGEACGNGS